MNTFNRNSPHRKPIRKTSRTYYIHYYDLKINTPYHISSLNKIKNLIITTLKKYDKVYSVVLPQKYGKILINSIDENYKFEFKGDNTDIPIMIYKNKLLTEC